MATFVTVTLELSGCDPQASRRFLDDGFSTVDFITPKVVTWVVPRSHCVGDVS